MEQPGGPPQPAPPQPPAGDVTPRLDGLRAWLATLDRMVENRTLIGLVLAALAVGAAAAANLPRPRLIEQQRRRAQQAAE